MKFNLAIRCIVEKSSGYGNFTRCMTLANSLHTHGIKIIFLINRNKTIENQLRLKKYEYHKMILVNCERSDNISIYPNPFENNINVKFSSEITSPVSISICDAVGRLVYYKTINDATEQIEIELETQLPRGSYVINVLNENQPYIQKLIKLN